MHFWEIVRRIDFAKWCRVLISKCNVPEG